jgi:hypothetical protein
VFDFLNPILFFILLRQGVLSGQKKGRTDWMPLFLAGFAQGVREWYCHGTDIMMGRSVALFEHLDGNGSSSSQPWSFAYYMRLRI